MKIIVYSFLILSFTAFGQGSVGYILEENADDSIVKRTVKTHSSIKPLIRQNSDFIKENKTFQISALGDLNYIQNNNSSFKTGLGVEVKGLISDKFFYRIAAVEGVSQTDPFYSPNTYIGDSIGSLSLYTDIHSRISFTPNHIFNFQVGIDNNFIGEGSRSMFLSDYGTSYPFGQIRMRFWRIEYTILYQFLREEFNNKWEGKFASSHHLSFNAAKWLNIGVFETVIFQPKDTLVNRGFDVEYLNPFVMYRPQEFSLGSSDNVLLGAELNAFWKGHTLYTQFIFDEFSLAEIKAKSGWWANKFAGQAGIKGRVKAGNNPFFYRLEYNFARPYTYSHLSKKLNHGTQGTALAHPYGANFMEILAEVKWSKNKMFAHLFTSYYLRGGSKDGFNYGEDIFLPYINRPSDFDHFIGDGNAFNGTKTVITLGYKVMKRAHLNAFIENHFDYNSIRNKVDYTFVVGLRSQLWNDRRNY